VAKRQIKKSSGQNQMRAIDKLVKIFEDDAVRGIKQLVLLDEWDSQLDEGAKVAYGTKINELGRSSALTVVQICHGATA
jgi:hypothetical protein